MTAPRVAPVVDARTHEGAAALARFEDEWRALAAATELGGVHFDPAWLAVFAEALGSVRVVEVRRGTRLVGALPLHRERRRIGGVPARVLRSLSDDHSQRFDFPVDGDDAAAALLDELLARADWDVLELRDVADGSRGGSPRLPAVARDRGLPTATWASQRSPYLTLPSTVEALEASVDAKFRANLRRRARNLARELGPVALERVDAADPRAREAALDDGFALERAGWKGDAGTAIACDAALDRRYRALAAAFAARGELALHFLTVGGKRVAFHFALERGGVYSLLKPGYDDALRRFGPGQLLTWEVARALVARGARELDFLGEDMDWKREWTDVTRAHRFLYVFRPTAFGRALAAWKARGVPAVRRIVGRALAWRR